MNIPTEPIITPKVHVDAPAPSTPGNPAPGMSGVDRRQFMRLAGLGFLATYTTLPLDSAYADVLPSTDPYSVFPQSVASGDPTSSGVVLWTRISADVFTKDAELLVQVAYDADFTRLAKHVKVEGYNIYYEYDLTVRVDLDGTLFSNEQYYYRFIYKGVTSRVGRCRTLCDAEFPLDSVKLAVVNCNDYTNGYYGAYYQVAIDKTIDFVVHVGDIIYETVTPTVVYPGHTITLPSGAPVSLGLADYRKLYQSYRSDPFFQMAMENHTWIIIWDDHEMANDNYHDYTGDAKGQSQGAPDHPYTYDPAPYETKALPTSVDLLRQLKYDSQQAWFEYTASRVSLNLKAADIFGRIQIYRSFKFGTLTELFMTDERTYRSSHPLGEVTYGERYIAPFELANPASATNSPARTMLGESQRDWFINGVATSDALWKAWGNEVLLSPLTVALPENATTLAAEINEILGTTIVAGEPSTFDNDSWDGYQYERIVIAESLAGAYLQTGRPLNTLNLVVLSGDLHSYVASYFKLNYGNPSNAADNVVGVEYMTPAITSANFKEQFAPFAAIGFSAANLEAIAMSPLVNPHMQFFNSSHFGYATVHFTRYEAVYTMFNVDKTVDATTASSTVLAKFQTPVNSSRIVRTV